MTQGLSASGFEHVVYRQVLGRILSVIYFPLWVVELTQGSERWLSVVDAVAESVVQPRAPLALADALAPRHARAPQHRRPAAAGVPQLRRRPAGRAGRRDLLLRHLQPGLADPRRGADRDPARDRPRRGRSAASRAGRRPLPAVLAARRRPRRARTDPRGCPRSATAGSRRCRTWPPASRPSRRPTSHGPGERPAAQGCFYDVEDAVLLARFTAAGRRRTSGRGEGRDQGRAHVQGARLVWIPFRREGSSLLDPGCRARPSGRHAWLE